MSLAIRLARAEDAPALAAALRAEDHAEFAALGDPAELIAGGIKNSAWAYVAEDEGGPVAVWGLSRATLLGGEGHAWCATTDRVALHRRRFAVASRAWVAAMLAECDRLSGWCDARYAVSLRWLRWLGAEIGPPVMTAGGVPFRRFEWRPEHGR